MFKDAHVHAAPLLANIGDRIPMIVYRDLANLGAIDRDMVVAGSLIDIACGAGDVPEWLVSLLRVDQFDLLELWALEEAAETTGDSIRAPVEGTSTGLLKRQDIAKRKHAL